MKKSPKSATAESPESEAALRATLHIRFEKNMGRHAGLTWAAVAARLDVRPQVLGALRQMEATGGEPDVVGRDPKTGEFLVVDCSPQSPAGRMSLCYDRQALDSRKEHKPKNSAMDLAASMGVELLTEEQYHDLQRLGEFDTKSSSWLRTPPEIRTRGGAIFGDRRFGRVFVYHNGAESYYSGRGLRAMLRV